MRLLYLIAFAGLFCTFSCGKKDGAIPTFIHIPEQTFEVGLEQGTAVQDFSEVWVIAGGKNLGVYELPADVPVLGEGVQTVRMLAGINNNGEAATKIVYPFIEPEDVSVLLGGGLRDTLVPNFRYRDNVLFELDSFEGFSTFVSDPSSEVSFSFINGEEAFENQSARVFMEGNDNVFRAVTEEAFDLPEGEAVFLEMHYKTNNSFAIGLRSEIGGSPRDEFAIIANGDTAPEWKKLYVELSFAMQQLTGADTYQLYIESVLDNNNTSGEILFDNFKIVYFD